jgi:methylaspartate mutase epsilon subunit
VPDERLYVLGIPAEHTRWFTQVGSGRPGRWGAFTEDADRIAEDVLAALGRDATRVRGAMPLPDRGAAR